MITARVKKQLSPGPNGSDVKLEIDLQTRQGITALYGAAGSGKTMVLEAIAGFLTPDEGRILLEDSILFDAASGVNLPPQRRRCGWIPQECSLFPHMTLQENLAFAVTCLTSPRLPRLERHRRVKETLQRFGLKDAAGKRPHEVPREVRQRCSFARAVICMPRVVLLDEPAQRLDPPLKTEFYQLLRQIQKDFRIPVLLATRDPEVCFELAEDLLVLHEGRVLQRGIPRAVFDQPATVEVARILGTFNLLPATITALDPVLKTSRLRVSDFDLMGPYFPGRLRGDNVTLCIRPDELTAMPREGKPGPNQLAAQLVRFTERLSIVRLEFTGNITVELARAEFERYRHNKDWLIHFPPQYLRAL